MGVYDRDYMHGKEKKKFKAPWFRKIQFLFWELKRKLFGK